MIHGWSEARVIQRLLYYMFAFYIHVVRDARARGAASVGDDMYALRVAIFLFESSFGQGEIATNGARNTQKRLTYSFDNRSLCK